MMQHAGADYLIEAGTEIANSLQRKLVDLQVVEFVLAFELLGVSYAGDAEIDAGDARRRPADRIFCRLRGSAAGDEYGIAFAVGSCGR